MRFIFDLDHTVIDSSHRQATLPNGDLNLQHWRENSTPEKIAQDSLLPLADEWKKARAKGSEIIVCTARVMGAADYNYLTSRGLYAETVISRRGGDRTPDDLLKLRGLQSYARERGISWRRFCKTSVMWDDNASVLQTLGANGLTVFDAVSFNLALEA